MITEAKQYELEYRAWQRAARRYRQAQAAKAHRPGEYLNQLVDNPPPLPPPLMVTREHIAWLDSKCEVDLSGLDQINQAGKGGQT